MTEPATILAVDDTFEVLTLLERILTREGYSVCTAESGAAALACVTKQLPDLFLLDLRMQGLGGLELCRQLKEREETRDIPVILISAFADTSEWVEGLRLGAVDYITKPFQPDELRARVRTHLDLGRAGVAMQRQASLLQHANEQLQREIRDRHEVESELRVSLEQAERSRRAMLSALEDHQRTANELRLSENKYRALFETSYDAIMTLEPPHWKFSSANPATLAMFRAKTHDEFLGFGPADLSPPTQPDGRPSAVAARELVDLAMRDGSACFDWTHRRLDGEAFPATVGLARMDWDGRKFLQATIRDMSAQKRLETELGQARKLEAVGQLAAGIAHEINTPSQYVGDGLQFLKEAFDGYRRLLVQYRSAIAQSGTDGPCGALSAKIREIEQDIDLTYLEENVPAAIDRSIDGISRIATIVRAMKEFAHPDLREMAYADLNQALRNTLAIARNEYKYVAQVELEFGELPPVLCHVGDINQVFLNLIVNAAHAIGELVGTSGTKGRIRIRTLAECDWAHIEVIDSGAGIPSSIRHRVFEPFFTTKEVGKGSGQGLAIARSIVAIKHRGTLTFESEEGKGTTFVIRLPVNGEVTAL